MNFGSGILLLASLPKSGEIRSSRGGRGLRRTSIYIVDEELWRWAKYFRAELEGSIPPSATTSSSSSRWIMRGI